MDYHYNFNLKNYNTFGIEAFAKSFATVTSLEELTEVVKDNSDFLVLGGGSNMLITQDIDRLVIHNQLKGITIVKQSENEVWVKAQAGENWHEFVLWCLANNFGGIENLSLIPGNVGTTPVQNIGAYGVEIKDVFYECEAMNVETQQMKLFTNAECEFEYRESVFKTKFKNEYIITSVTFKLTTHYHILHTQYGAIQTELLSRNIQTTPTIQDISDAVIAIRQSKLPDPKVLGNSGSFFKNPIITVSKYNELLLKHPEMPYYKAGDGLVKVPAGWLIEQSGFKGKKIGNAGVHTQQALVLVNYGNATGLEVYNLAKDIQQTVYTNFDISIEMEVNII